MKIENLHPVEIGDAPANLVQAVLKTGANWGGAVMMNEQEDIVFARDPLGKFGERDQNEPDQGWLHPVMFTLNDWKTVHSLENGARRWQSPETLEWYQQIVVTTRSRFLPGNVPETLY